MDMEVTPLYGSIRITRGSMSSGISKLSRESRTYLLNKPTNSREKTVIIVREISLTLSPQDKKQCGVSRHK
jgi:hypothetical protein